MTTLQGAGHPAPWFDKERGPAMTPEQRAAMVADGIERAHSFRSPGHWDATTTDLTAGWHSANRKVNEATTPDAVFLAAIGREQCAMVLRHRGVTVA